MSHKEMFCADPEVVACELDGGAALLDLRTSTYFSLNPVGAAVWAALARPSNLDRLCEAVVERFEVTPEACRSDISVLVTDLCNRRLARKVDA